MRYGKKRKSSSSLERDFHHLEYIFLVLIGQKMKEKQFKSREWKYEKYLIMREY